MHPKLASHLLSNHGNWLISFQFCKIKEKGTSIFEKLGFLQSIGFRSNIFMKQKLTFLVTFPYYFRDYRTIFQTFLGDGPDRWPNMWVSASWKCCFWKKFSCSKNCISVVFLIHILARINILGEIYSNMDNFC